VTRLSPMTGKTLSTVGHSGFVEPIGISADRKGDIYVADNGTRSIFCFDLNGEYKYTIKRESFKLLGGIVTPGEKCIVVADTALHIMKETENAQKLASQEIKVNSQGRFAGVAVDDFGNCIAIRTEKTKSVIQIFKDNKILSTIDSHDSKLKRPSDICVIDSNHILVVDLGNNCLKQYRYR